MRSALVRNTVLLLLAASGIALARFHRVQATEHFLESQSYEDVYYLPPAEWLPALSFGYQEALADLIWMKSLVYIGDEFIDRGDLENVFRYGEAMVGLDPDFERVYRWVGTLGVYRPEGVTPDDVWRTVDFLQRGVDRWPDDGRLAWELAATLAYELPNFIEDQEVRDQARERALPYFMRAVRLGNAPEWMALGNIRRLQALGQNERALAHLEEMYATVSDPELAAELEAQMVELRGEGEAEALRHSREELLENHQRDFPWITPTLYLLVGERPVIDSAELRRNRYLPAHDELD